MLYRTLKRMIETDQIEGMREKLEVFWAADRITKSEYDELMTLLEGRI